MPFSQPNKTKIKNYYTPQKMSLLSGTLITTGAGRPDAAKESNFLEIQHYLTGEHLNNRLPDVTEAAGILGEVLGRVVEVKEPPADNGAARKLALLISESSTVQRVLHGVDTRLDNDQLKHQPKAYPIGNRHKGGGNRFNDTADSAWHILTTLDYMADWAKKLVGMGQGEIRYHGQAIPVGGIHYEGYCLMATGAKYVIFHCYPSNTSALLGPKG